MWAANTVGREGIEPPNGVAELIYSQRPLTTWISAQEPLTIFNEQPLLTSFPRVLGGNPEVRSQPLWMPDYALSALRAGARLAKHSGMTPLQRFAHRQSRRRGLNSRPSAYKADALPLSYVGALTRAPNMLRGLRLLARCGGIIP